MDKGAHKKKSSKSKPRSGRRRNGEDSPCQHQRQQRLRPILGGNPPARLFDSPPPRIKTDQRTYAQVLSGPPASHFYAPFCMLPAPVYLIPMVISRSDTPPPCRGPEPVPEDEASRELRPLRHLKITERQDLDPAEFQDLWGDCPFLLHPPVDFADPKNNPILGYHYSGTEGPASKESSKQDLVKHLGSSRHSSHTSVDTIETPEDQEVSQVMGRGRK